MDRFEFVNLVTDANTPPLVRHWHGVLRRVYQHIARDDVSSVDMEVLSGEFSLLCRGEWQLGLDGECVGILLLPPADVIADIIIAGQTATEIEIKQIERFAEGIADALANICKARAGQLCICAICEDVVEAGNSRRTYCSNKCKLRAFYKRRKDEQSSPAKTKITV